MQGVFIEKPFYIQKNTGERRYLARILLGMILIASLTLYAVYVRIEGNKKLAEKLTMAEASLKRAESENSTLKKQLEVFLEKTTRLNQLYQSTLEKATATASGFDAEKTSLGNKVFELEELNGYLLSKIEALQTELRATGQGNPLPGSRRQTDPNDSSITREWIT